MQPPSKEQARIARRATRTRPYVRFTLADASHCQVMDFLYKCKDVAYANFLTLQKAGLFNFANIKVFTEELAFPFTMFWENRSVAYVQSILLAQYMDLNVRCSLPANRGKAACAPYCAHRCPLLLAGASLTLTVPRSSATLPASVAKRRRDSSA